MVANRRSCKTENYGKGGIWFSFVVSLEREDGTLRAWGMPPWDLPASGLPIWPRGLPGGVSISLQEQESRGEKQRPRAGALGFSPGPSLGCSSWTLPSCVSQEPGGLLSLLACFLGPYLPVCLPTSC